jgi:hypothetical protein
MSTNTYLLTLPQLLSAKQKISRVALFYDPVKFSLKGFDSEKLDPTEFREQLRQNFLIRLTDEELGAIVLLFDKDGDGTVDSVEFINEFFRMGKVEKRKFVMSRKDENDRKEKERVQRFDEHKERFMKFGVIKVASSCTKAQEDSAFKKMSMIAFSYDVFKGGLEVCI